MRGHPRTVLPRLVLPGFGRVTALSSRAVGRTRTHTGRHGRARQGPASARPTREAPDPRTPVGARTDGRSSDSRAWQVTLPDLLAVASRARTQCFVTAVVPTHRCGAVPESHRVPSCLTLPTQGRAHEPSAPSPYEAHGLAARAVLTIRGRVALEA